MYNNKKKDISGFNYQLSNWLSLNELESITRDFRKTDYGKVFIIKRHKNQKVYAVFTKKEKDIKEIIEKRTMKCLFENFLSRKFYMIKHLPKRTSRFKGENISSM